MDEIQFRKLKKEHEEAARKASEARGALQSLNERLRGEFGLKSLAEAKEKLEELQNEATRARKAFEANLSRYRKEFGNDE